MKKVKIAVVLTLLVLSGAALAGQPAEQQKGSSMEGMMERMMKGEKGMEGMSGKDGMMRMTKMMDQCSAMMESSHGSEKAGESQK